MHTSVTYNEKELIHLIANGNENAFRQLFYAYHNKLGSFVYRITESLSLTEDIVQDVFLKVWLNRAQLQKVQCMDAYIFTIARNHTFNCLKQLARERCNKSAWLANSLYTANAAESSGKTDIESIVEIGVAQLPPRQKKVYLLSRQHGLQQKEIARQMNISVETVKKHMVLALRFLKTYIRTHSETLFIFLLASYLKF